MGSMKEIREWQIGQLEKAINVVKQIIQNASAEESRILRDGGDGWTIREVMGHIRDFEEVFLERSRMTLEQEMADLPFPDPPTLVVERNYNGDDHVESFQSWSATRREHLALLGSVAGDDWERPANHPTRGLFTLSDQLFLTVWHDMNHIEQMAHILLEERG